MRKSEQNEETRSPWLRIVLIFAALYHIAAGTWIFLQPTAFFSFVQMAPPEPLSIWRLFGLVFYVFGLGYALAGINPSRHWPITLIGLVWNMLVPIALGRSILEGTEAFSHLGAFLILLNHLLWWIPFASILYFTAKQGFQQSHHYRYREAMELRTAMEVFSTSKGVGLYDATREQPVLLAFLGQFGAPWTKRALADLSEKRDRIEGLGILPVAVHMASPNDGRRRFVRSKMPDLPAISDPHCELYRAFGLDKASRYGQLPRFRLLWQVLKSAVLQGAGLRGRTGDLWQMPGVFLVSRGKILWGYHYSRLSDRVDFMKLVMNSGIDPSAGRGEEKKPSGTSAA